LPVNVKRFADEAPDPIFFLHHTQLDRLWWLWQQRQLEGGLTAYSGHKHRHSLEMSSLEDGIEMQGLAPLVKVADVMDVRSDLLCYTY
jgi:tyrosinase